MSWQLVHAFVSRKVDCVRKAGFARVPLCVCAIPPSVMVNRSTEQFYFNFFYISETSRSFLFRRQIARVLASCFKAAKTWHAL
jgi:hypothetical protein